MQITVIFQFLFYRLKRTSPTAYCDCWEKCKCKTLIAGQKAARLDLLYRLLTTTNLVTTPNSRCLTFFSISWFWKSNCIHNVIYFVCLFSVCRGEHILLFLVQTVARQSVEHCQYRPPRIREDRNRKAANAEGRFRKKCAPINLFVLALNVFFFFFLEHFLNVHLNSVFSLFVIFQTLICLTMIWSHLALLSWLWKGSFRTGMPLSPWLCLVLRRIKIRKHQNMTLLLFDCV